MPHSARLQQAIVDAFIRGRDIPDRKPWFRGEIAHMNTFVAMLAGQLPNVKMLCLYRVRWTENVRLASTKYFRLFASITELKLAAVTFKDASSFSALLCSLLHLRHLCCTEIQCESGHTPSSSDYLPRGGNCKVRVSDIDMASGDVLAWFGAIYPVHELRWTVTAGEESRPQQLLDAYGETIHVLRFYHTGVEDVRSQPGKLPRPGAYRNLKSTEPRCFSTM